MLEIQIQKGDITKADAEAIVYPANSLGWMGGTSATSIKKAGGEEIERQIAAKAPLEIGFAIATDAGKLPQKSIIHAPTVETPTEKAIDYNIRLSTRGALLLADDMKFKSIAMTGLGTGIGSFPKEAAAKIMIDEIKKFKPINLGGVILVDIDREMVEAWQKELK